MIDLVKLFPNEKTVVEIHSLSEFDGLLEDMEKFDTWLMRDEIISTAKLFFNRENCSVGLRMVHRTYEGVVKLAPACNRLQLYSKMCRIYLGYSRWVPREFLTVNEFMSRVLEAEKALKPPMSRTWVPVEMKNKEKEKTDAK